MKKILVLFPNEWDRGELSAARFRGRYQVCYEGFDLSHFPENARLLVFNVRRFIEAIVARYRRENLAGVFSTDEQFGAMIAAVVARRLGLPGAAPANVLLTQHKYYARVRQREIAPESTPRFCVFPPSVTQAHEIALPFPLFVKPVKATYSVLARRVDGMAELRRHLAFGPFERRVLEKLIRPFDDLSADLMNFRVDALHLIGEQILTGVQVTIEGYSYAGEVHIIGVVDSVMYPGTSAFQRFEYPSRLPAAVQQRMRVLAEELVHGFGWNHGLFNVEMFYDAAADTLKIIEFNPRLAYQFADLYEKVDGFNTYDALLALALGERPALCRGAGRYRNAASFVLRAFERRTIKTAPDRNRIEKLRRRYRDARLMIYVKRGASMEREAKWLGSYRYAVLNLGAMSSAHLFERFHSIKDELAFEFT